MKKSLYILAVVVLVIFLGSCEEAGGSSEDVLAVEGIAPADLAEFTPDEAVFSADGMDELTGILMLTINSAASLDEWPGLKYYDILQYLMLFREPKDMETAKGAGRAASSLEDHYFTGNTMEVSVVLEDETFTFTESFSGLGEINAGLLLKGTMARGKESKSLGLGLTGGGELLIRDMKSTVPESPFRFDVPEFRFRFKTDSSLNLSLQAEEVDGETVFRNGTAALQARVPFTFGVSVSQLVFSTEGGEKITPAGKYLISMDLSSADLLPAELEIRDGYIQMPETLILDDLSFTMTVFDNEGTAVKEYTYTVADVKTILAGLMRK